MENREGDRAKGGDSVFRVSYTDTADRRARLLQAARRVMAEIGYERAALDDIAREAGTSETEALELFHGKPKLLEAVFNEAWEPLNARVADIVVASVSTRDRKSVV